MLDRANPVTDLLNADWASRQTEIAALNNSNTLWQTYGADQQKFSDALAELNSLGFTPFQNTVNGQYVTSPESRTIWVTVDEINFATLFGATLLEGFTPAPEPGLFSLIKFWEGNLSLPQELIDAGVVGLWFDSSELDQPILANPGAGQGVTLPEGPQGVGNSADDAKYPNEIAELYNFPFASPDLWKEVTGTIGLVEPGIGNALPGVTDPQI